MNHRWWWALLAMPLAVTAQCTLVFRWLPAGGSPDFVLLLTLACAWWRGIPGGAAAGFWGGLLMGAARGNLCGPMAVIYLAAGWLAGAYLQERDDRVALLWLGAAATVIVCGLEAGLMAVLGFSYSVGLAALAELALCHSLLLAPVSLGPRSED
ncbi:MAG: hypothetical protein HY319_01955 [Armatimonadetes bacterium]|nr:hypothetical protein [Armatimonadota bacterium]